LDKASFEELKRRSVLRESPFYSAQPVFGPLIARFRQAWNSISTKWYVRPLIQQQSEFNQLIAQHLWQMSEQLNVLAARLDEAEMRLKEMRDDLGDADARLIEADHEQTAIRHDMAEMALHLTQLKQALSSQDKPTPRQESP